MAWRLDDRWLWLGFGVVIFVAARGISHGLRDTLNLTSFDEPVKHVNKSNESDAEDSIPLESLHTLAGSPNADIANAAISLLVSRFALSDSACNQLTLELFSKSNDVCKRATHILDLLDDYPLPAHFSKPDIILRPDYVKQYQQAHKADQNIQAMCVAFFKAFGRLQQGMLGYRDVAEAVEAASLASSPPAQEVHRAGSWHAFRTPTLLDSDHSFPDLDLSVESLENILSSAGSTSQPVRVPTAALSALLHSHAGRRGTLSATRSTRQFPEESPEEAEIRRRRNRAARVMEIAEDYIIV